MKKKSFYRIGSYLCILFLCLSMLSGCGGQKKLTSMKAVNDGPLFTMDDKYKTFYEVFLYSYYDSNKDGIGDIRGLTQKLDYLNDGDDKTNTDLGVNGIWLMPIMPSDSYHKYDVKDYESIDPSYGTLDDFKELVKAAHKRKISLIIDFVMNHTSSEHPWFTQACDYLKGLHGQPADETKCPYISYYHFTQKKENDTYYPVGDSGWYYEGEFSSNMPDLNLENEQVKEEFSKIVDFWLGLGVDGFRLDAAGEYDAGNDAQNIKTLRWFNDMVKQKDKDAYIVAEVWKGFDTYKTYYQSGIDSCFDFSFANASGIIANTLKHTSGANALTYGNSIVSAQKAILAQNKDAIDAPFYTNHDMGRSAGYYSGDFAENKVKIAGAMNLFMSGNAFVYYGEELGMKGAGKDENKRAPMYWSKDKNAIGMCQGPPNMDEVKMLYPSLEEQESDEDSIYNFYKQAILLRNRYPQIARGREKVINSMSDENTCAIAKTYKKESIVLLYNLSDHAQTVSVDTKEFEKLNIKNPVIGGMLLSDKGSVTYKEDKEVTLPPYSVVLFSKKK